jgi:hypothetical protein
MTTRSFVPPAPPKTQKPIPDEDTHVSRLYSVIDLGTVAADGQFAKDKNGNQRYKREIMFTWELPEAKHVFKQEKGPEPFVVSQTYTFSLGAKANLRKMVDAWRGKPMTDDEASKFDILALLGQPCLITIAHEESQAGFLYPKIMSVSKLPKGMTCPPPINPTIMYHINDLDGGNYSKLHEWIQKKIQLSEEWKHKDETVKPPYEPSEDRPPVDNEAADEYAAELERKANDPFA